MIDEMVFNGMLMKGLRRLQMQGEIALSVHQMDSIATVALEAAQDATRPPEHA